MSFSGCHSRLIRTTKTEAMKKTPITMIATPATLSSACLLSRSSDPAAVALSPRRMKMAENVATKIRQREISCGSMRRSPTAGPAPLTAAR